MKLKEVSKWVIIAGLISTFGPVVIALFSGLIAWLLGCELHEGFVNPCTLIFFDIGELLYIGGMFGWFTLILAPIGVGLTVIAGVVWLFLKIFT